MNTRDIVIQIKHAQNIASKLSISQTKPTTSSSCSPYRKRNETNNYLENYEQFEKEQTRGEYGTILELKKDRGNVKLAWNSKKGLSVGVGSLLNLATHSNKATIKVSRDVKPNTAMPNEFRVKTSVGNRKDNDLSKLNTYMYKKSSKLSDNTFDVNSSMIPDTRRVRFLYAKDPIPSASCRIKKSPILLK